MSDSSSSAVVVAVRCRPMSENEIKECGTTRIISMEGQQTTIADPSNKIRPLPFTFDHSFWSGDTKDSHFATQEMVFNALGTRILDSAFAGYNACLFAYGQTGSGKTYSMMGYGAEKGIIPQLCESLFAQGISKKEAKSGNWELHVEVSYLEIYNEKCRCLLNPQSKNIDYKVREHPVTGPYVDHLTLVVVKSFEDIDRLMVAGNKTRTVASTNMNATSSRSHAIFTLKVTQITTHPGQGGAQSEMVAKINLVDLAGSERASRTGASGQTLKEGSNINQSLTTLGKVINGLAEGMGADGKPKKHVPFRDSALTWLLKENLSGNSKTIMLAALSPAPSNYEETVSTLRYADRAKALRTVATVNEDASSKKIRELTEEIDQLKKQLQESIQRGPGPEMSVRSKEDEEKEIASQLKESETLRQLEQQSWKEKEEHTREVEKLREELAAQQGMGNRISREHPSLVNLNEDPMMTECLFYTLAPGITNLGSEVADTKRDIQLQGEHIIPRHAHIKVNDVDGEFITVLTPHGEGEVYVNGERATVPTDLHHNARLIFGLGHVFRYADPRVSSGVTKTGANTVSYAKALEERFASEREEMLKKASSAPVRLSDGGNGSFVVMKAEQQEEQTQRMHEMEERIRTMETETQEAARKYKAPTVSGSRSAISSITESPQGSPLQQAAKHTSLLSAARMSSSKARLPNQQMFKQKVVLLGHQEVGKTSLRKSFEGDPLFSFMSRLPEVRSTTGIDNQIRTVMVNDDAVELKISDFAGQEAYHSHTHFLTGRSVFLLVWKISAVEQDFRSTGISEHEEERLCQWIAEVYAKYPQSKLMLVATHLDEMRDQSPRAVSFILDKVQKLITQYAVRIARTDASGQAMVLPVLGSFAVSCKTRTFMSIGRHKNLSGKRIGELLSVIAEACHDACNKDPAFPSAAIPGRHVRLMRELQAIKDREDDDFLLSIGEYINLAVRLGIESDEELLQISQLLHNWDVIFMFNREELQAPENAFVFLHPALLCKVAGMLFSFAHVIHTPIHLRALIGGLDYDIKTACVADMNLLSMGYLRFPLARILFHGSISEFLKRNAEDHEIAMFLQLLSAMELMYQVPQPCTDKAILEEEGTLANNAPPGQIHRYFVPSLSPFTAPVCLKESAPILFHNGLHIKHSFNMIPNEMWYKLQYRLRPYIKFMSVPCPIEGYNGNVGGAGYRLLESDEVHNRWKDGMWLHNDAARVLVIREKDIIRMFSAEVDSVGAEELHGKVESQIKSVLKEYEGIQRTVMIECPVPHCTAWHKVGDVVELETMHCPECSTDYPSSAFASSGTSSLGEKHFSDIAKRGMRKMMQDSLDSVALMKVAEFLKISITDEDEPSPVVNTSNLEEKMDQVHVLHSLDNIVRHLMLKEHWELNSS